MQGKMYQDVPSVLISTQSQKTDRRNNNRTDAFSGQRPITFTSYYTCRYNNIVPHIKNYQKIEQSPQKGLIFIWPQRRKSYCMEKLTLLMRILANSLYWCHAVNLYPNGSGELIYKHYYCLIRPMCNLDLFPRSQILIF